MATTPRNKPIRPVTRALIAKASKDDEQQVACFDETGTLIGICRASDITPVTNPTASGSTTAKKQPTPTRSAQTEAAAGEEPEMGIQKARATAGQLKKQLYTSATTEEQNQLATAMNVAAADVLKEIHARPRRRRS